MVKKIQSSNVFLILVASLFLGSCSKVSKMSTASILSQSDKDTMRAGALAISIGGKMSSDMAANLVAVGMVQEEAEVVKNGALQGLSIGGSSLSLTAEVDANKVEQAAPAVAQLGIFKTKELAR